MNSVKCPQCGLSNFATDEKCKRCDADLTKSPEQKREEKVESEIKAVKYPNLLPCPDCGRMTSRLAAACPQCGRFIQSFPIKVDRTGWIMTIVLALLFISFIDAIVLLLFYAVSSTPRYRY
jgi:uncharacterized OB-fold protein